MHHEQRKFREVCETAAATASTIFHTVSSTPCSSWSPSPDPIQSPCSWMTTGIPAEATSLPPPHPVNLAALSDDFSEDLYTFDENVMPWRPDCHRHRSSSISFNSRPMLIPPNTTPPYQLGSSIPIPQPPLQPSPKTQKRRQLLDSIWNEASGSRA